MQNLHRFHVHGRYPALEHAPHAFFHVPLPRLLLVFQEAIHGRREWGITIRCAFAEVEDQSDGGPGGAPDPF